MVKYKIMVWACQVGPFHFTLTQVNSEMNCMAKNKCPDSQKVDTRWELQRHITRVKSNNMYIFAFFVFDSFYVMQEKRQKIWLLF